MQTYPSVDSPSAVVKVAPPFLVLGAGGKHFHKERFVPVFSQIKEGQRTLSAPVENLLIFKSLKVKVILMPKWHVLGRCILIPFKCHGIWALFYRMRYFKP